MRAITPPLPGPAKKLPARPALFPLRSAYVSPNHSAIMKISPFPEVNPIGIR